MNLKLLVCFVHKKKLLDKILAKIMEHEIGGVTVLDSTGVGRSKIEDIMLYEGFKDVLRGTQKDHYTVLCLLQDKKVKGVAKDLTDLYGGFEEKGIGFFFTVPIDQVWGIHMGGK